MKAMGYLSILAVVASAHGQTPNGEPPSFEVVSVKPAASGSAMVSMSTDQNQLRYSNVTLRDIVLNAYGVKEYQISGPELIDTARFEIVAKIPANVPKEQAPLMLQGLLADRFKMTMHWEKREMQAYALVVARDGSKLQASGEEGRISMGMGHVEAQGITVANLTIILARIVNRPVSDMTAIKGSFRFKLDWEPETSQSIGVLPEPKLSSSAVPNLATGATIFAAIQEQLGLRLEAQKQQVEFLVIDHVEKLPTAN